MDFEANRKRILEDLKKQKDRKKISASKPSSTYVNHEPKKDLKENIVIFGQKTPFLNNLVASLAAIYKVDVLYDVDKATDFITEHSIQNVIIDIDPPSDYHLAANFLTVVISIVSDIKLFICTRNRNDSHARALAGHGGILLDKPVSIPELKALISGEDETS